MATTATQAKRNHGAKLGPRQSELIKGGAYNARCHSESGGFCVPAPPQKKGDTRWEAHHILCEISMARRDRSNQYVEDCLWLSTWDINQADNLIGLPRIRQFRKKGSAGDGLLPCHQVDHLTSDGYTYEVSVELEKLFGTITAEKANHPDGKSIAEDLKGISSDFLAKLKKRALRGPGSTTLGWQQRFTHKKWYMPFSMAKKVRKRNPGSGSDKLANVLRQAKS